MHIKSNKLRRSGAGPAGERGLSLVRRHAFTLVEAMVSLLIVGLSLGGILGVYIQCAKSSDWSASSLSAQMMALGGLEQCRAAKYDPRGSPATDNLVSSNFPSKVDVLDVGSSVGVVAYGTNTT